MLVSTTLVISSVKNNGNVLLLVIIYDTGDEIVATIVACPHNKVYIKLKIIIRV
jgi:hypothetical protein